MDLQDVVGVCPDLVSTGLHGPAEFRVFRKLCRNVVDARCVNLEFLLAPDVLNKVSGLFPCPFGCRYGFGYLLPKSVN